MKKSLKTLGALLAPVGLVAASAVAIPLTSCSNSKGNDDGNNVDLATINQDAKYNWIVQLGSSSTTSNGTYEEGLASAGEKLCGEIVDGTKIGLVEVNYNEFYPPFEHGISFSAFNRDVGQNAILNHVTNGHTSSISLSLLNESDSKYFKNFSALASSLDFSNGRISVQSFIDETNGLKSEMFGTEPIQIIFKADVSIANGAHTDTIYFAFNITSEWFA